MPQAKTSGTSILVKPTINKAKSVVDELQKELNALAKQLNISPTVDFTNIDKLKKELNELKSTKIINLEINDEQLRASISNISDEYIQKLSSALSSKTLDNEVNRIDIVFKNLNNTLKGVNKTLGNVTSNISAINTKVGDNDLSLYADDVKRLANSFDKLNNIDDTKISRTLDSFTRYATEKVIKFNVGFQDNAAQTLREKAVNVAKTFEEGSYIFSSDAKLANTNTVRFGAAFKENAAVMLARQVADIQKVFDDGQANITVEVLKGTTEEALQRIINELNAELKTNAKYKLNLNLGAENLREQVKKVNKEFEKIKVPDLKSALDPKTKKAKRSGSASLKEYKKVNENLVSINNTLTGIAEKLTNQKETNLRLDKESLAVMQQITAEALKQQNIENNNSDTGSSNQNKSSKKSKKSSGNNLTDNQVIKKLKSYSNEIIKAEIALANTDKVNKELYVAREKVVESARKQYETEQKNLKLTKQQKQVANDNLEIRLKAAQETNKASIREQEALNKVAKLQHEINTIRADAARNQEQYNLFKKDDVTKVAQIEEWLNKAQSRLTQLNASLNNHDLSSFDTMYANISDSVNAAKNLGKALTKDTDQAGKIAKNVSKLETQGARLSQYFNKYNSELKKHSELYQKFLDLQFKLNNGLLTEPQAKTAVSSLLIEARAAGVEVDNLWRKLQRTFGSRVRSWVAGDSLFLITSSLRQIYQNVVQIDTAMTELRKVTDATSKEYIQFLDDAETRARRLGATLVETVNATSDFARLGYSISESSNLADAALTYLNVGDKKFMSSLIVI